jgi:CheY-like chemotaxis protein
MNGSRILVVDDDDDIRNLVKTLLERGGAEVREA